MKKFSHQIFLISGILLLIFLNPFNAKAEMSTEGKGEFTKALNSLLKDTINYYHDNSITTLDVLQKEQADVVKVVKTDDPDTPENEEVIEEYQSDIFVALVEYEQKRDTFFTFKKKEMYYYDLENDQFLSPSSVFLNEEVEDFFQKNIESLGKHITPVSLIIAIIMISFIVLVPLVLMVFKRTSSAPILYENNSLKG